MLDCVTADDGNNYSRAGIEEWFAKGKEIRGESPIFGDSNKQIHRPVIWPNHQFFVTQNHSPLVLEYTVVQALSGTYMPDFWVIIYTSFWADMELLSPQSLRFTAT